MQTFNENINMCVYACKYFSRELSQHIQIHTIKRYEKWENKRLSLLKVWNKIKIQIEDE